MGITFSRDIRIDGVGRRLGVHVSGYSYQNTALIFPELCCRWPLRRSKEMKDSLAQATIAQYGFDVVFIQDDNLNRGLVKYRSSEQKN